MGYVLFHFPRDLFAFLEIKAKPCVMIINTPVTHVEINIARARAPRLPVMQQSAVSSVARRSMFWCYAPCQTSEVVLC